MLQPIRLGPNQPIDRPYRGGAGIVALRGEGSPDGPEDFVASTTTVHGDDRIGLTFLPDGRSLREAVHSDPTGWLGAAHVARYGPDTALLVKILSTGERLFNHVHPDGAFAARVFDSPRGKTEAWLITDTGSGADGQQEGTVWVGFRDSVTRSQLRDWFEQQDVEAMLAALHEVTVRPGDWLHVPAGLPHSIGPGITIVELQEPTDLSIVLEYQPFPALTREQALLGLEVETALSAVTIDPLSAERLSELHGRAEEGSRVPLLPPEASTFFRAERLTVTAAQPLEAGFRILVVLDGAGLLRWEQGELSLQRGETVLVPHGAGDLTVGGDLQLISCAPPAP